MSWLDDYASTASQYVDAPTAFQKVIAYWTLGAAIGKRAYYQFGMVPIYPNTYLVLIGKSGFVKKSVTKNFALDVLDAAIPDLDLPGRGSPEAFRDSLDEHGWYGVLHYDEFYEYLTKRKKDYTADMDVTVMELFAYGRKTPIRTKTSGEIRIPSESIISFVAPTTMDLFLAGLRKDDLLGGKMARFMLHEGDQDIEYPVPPPLPQTTIKYLGIRLAALVPGLNPPAPPVEIKETKEARECLEAYYFAIKKRVEDTKNVLFTSAFSRAQVYAIKLAMIHAIAEGRRTMHPDDYEAVMPFITNWADCLRRISERMGAENNFQQQIAKAEEFLRLVPTTKMRDLQRHMKLRKYEMVDLMEHLNLAGIVDVVTHASNPGETEIRLRGSKMNGNGHKVPEGMDPETARMLAQAEEPPPLAKPKP